MCDNIVILWIFLICSVHLCGFWTLPSSIHLDMDPDPSLTTLVKCLPDVPLLYIGFGSMETYMLDVGWEAVFTTFDSGTITAESLHKCSIRNDNIYSYLLVIGVSLSEYVHKLYIYIYMLCPSSVYRYICCMQCAIYSNTNLEATWKTFCMPRVTKGCRTINTSRLHEAMLNEDAGRSHPLSLITLGHPWTEMSLT